jgi:hypothetical protein
MQKRKNLAGMYRPYYGVCTYAGHTVTPNVYTSGCEFQKTVDPQKNKSILNDVVFSVFLIDTRILLASIESVQQNVAETGHVFVFCRAVTSICAF